MSATSSSLHSIECSDQPLDLSFHPQRDTLVAAALVDGTVEVHDFQSVISEKEKAAAKDDDDDDDDDEDDTILSSNHIHKQLIPNPAAGAAPSTKKSDDDKKNPKYSVKKASCRTVLFSNHNHNGHRLYTGGSAGDLCCLDSELICSFRTDSKSPLVWRIDSASVGSGSSSASANYNNPLHVLHQLPACSSKGSLIVSGDDLGGVRVWDERLCNVTTTNQQTGNTSGPLQLPRGCVLSWKEHKDYISAIDHSEDGNTLLATSADGCLSIYDLRNASTSRVIQNPNISRKSDPQDDELLSLTIMKNGKKVVVGTQDGVLDIWSWGTWGDISDRYPVLQNSHSSVDAILKVDEDTLLMGSSDGLVRVVTLFPNKVLGALGDHDGFPIETLQFNANRSYVGSISHDPYIRLWDTSILNDDDDDDDSDDEEMEEGGGGGGGDSKPSAAGKPSNTNKLASNNNKLKFSVAKGGQASDDEWDDMDEEDEEENDDDDDDKDSDDSDDDSDDDDEKRPSRSDNRASKLKSKNEDFFADL